MHYLDETCLHEFDDVGFGVVVVKDVLQKGATTGMVSNLPKFPTPEFGPGIKHKVALFHGNVAATTVGCIPKDYDFAMLGDIHLQQISGAKTSTHKAGYEVVAPL